MTPNMTPMGINASPMTNYEPSFNNTSPTRNNAIETLEGMAHEIDAATKMQSAPEPISSDQDEWNEATN